jgi:hypothetical protein
MRDRGLVVVMTSIGLIDWQSFDRQFEPYPVECRPCRLDCQNKLPGPPLYSCRQCAGLGSWPGSSHGRVQVPGRAWQRKFHPLRRPFGCRGRRICCIYTSSCKKAVINVSHSMSDAPSDQPSARASRETPVLCLRMDQQYRQTFW